MGAVNVIGTVSALLSESLITKKEHRPRAMAPGVTLMHPGDFPFGFSQGLKAA